MPLDEVAPEASDSSHEDPVASEAPPDWPSGANEEPPRAEAEQTHSVVVHDAYDAGAFAHTLELSPRLKGLVHGAAQRLATAAALVEDVFYTLYQPAPTLRPAEELSLASLVNRAIVEQLVATSDWDALRRAGTVGDQLCSAIATRRCAGVC